MNTNSLPKNYSTIYKIGRFLKGKKNNSNNSEEIVLVSSLKKIEIENIDSCNDTKIQKLFLELKPFKKYINVYIHGSWADNTKNTFSDIDDFIIIDIESLERENYLSKVCKIINRIDMKFCRIDPIQHHGHWICSKNDLKNYNNSFIPLHILNEAKVIIGKNKILGLINQELTQEGLRKNIINTCNGIQLLSKKLFSNSINAYELKGLAGSFVIMPAFIMQLNGHNCSKPEAIKESHTFFSNQALICIEWSTNNRNNWGLVTSKFQYKLFSKLTYFFFDPHIWRRFSNKFSPKVQESTINKLSDKVLTPEIVEKFISESLIYAK